MAPISANALQKDLFKYLDRTIDKNEILNVSTPKGTVIILNPEKYQKQLAEIEELKLQEALSDAADDIENGRVYPFDEVIARLRKRNKEFSQKEEL
jgi:hypothetical protein